jgi:hypothetical protein
MTAYQEIQGMLQNSGVQPKVRVVIRELALWTGLGWKAARLNFFSKSRV